VGAVIDTTSNIIMKLNAIKMIACISSSHAALNHDVNFRILLKTCIRARVTPKLNVRRIGTVGEEGNHDERSIVAITFATE
jgi:hypothetical protein